MKKLLAADPKFVPRGAPGPGLVKVTFHDFVNEDEADAYAYADNKLGQLAGWDDKLLSKQLAALNARGVDLKTGLGFADWQLTKLLREHTKPIVDVVPEPPKVTITKPGDIWILGNSRTTSAIKSISSGRTRRTT